MLASDQYPKTTAVMLRSYLHYRGEGNTKAQALDLAHSFTVHCRIGRCDSPSSQAVYQELAAGIEVLV